MSRTFDDLDDVDAFLDDIGIWSNDFDEHMASIKKVLHHMDANGFTINPLKREWAVQKTDWLGYWLTPTGLKPWKKTPFLTFFHPQTWQNFDV
jgi:hypothetical protein